MIAWSTEEYFNFTDTFWVLIETFYFVFTFLLGFPRYRNPFYAMGNQQKFVQNHSILQTQCDQADTRTKLMHKYYYHCHQMSWLKTSVRSNQFWLNMIAHVLTWLWKKQMFFRKIERAIFDLYFSDAEEIISSKQNGKCASLLTKTSKIFHQKKGDQMGLPLLMRRNCKTWETSSG